MCILSVHLFFLVFFLSPWKYLEFSVISIIKILYSRYGFTFLMPQTLKLASTSLPFILSQYWEYLNTSCIFSLFSLAFLMDLYNSVSGQHL